MNYFISWSVADSNECFNLSSQMYVNLVMLWFMVLKVVQNLEEYDESRTFYLTTII